jgi:excisionase family DNA binding protein
MPRARKGKLWPVALSPSQASDAIGVHADIIAAAIKSGALRCFKLGTKRRILWRDLNRWIIRTWRRV